MWELTEEQRLIEESAQKFLQSGYDFESRKARLLADDDGESMWAQFAEMGWLGLTLPEDYGGFGGGITEVAVLMRAFGAHLVVEPFTASVVLGGYLVQHGARRATAMETIGGIIDGTSQLAVAFAEPDSRFDLERVSTQAQSTGDGAFVLNGRKSVVVNATGAQTIIVSARTAGGAGDLQGITLFLVPADTAGISISGYRLNDDTKAGDITFQDVKVPEAAVLGEPGQGFELLEEAIDFSTVAACAEAVGAMETVMTMTTEYLNTREQFGRAIGKNQALQFRMVDLHYLLEESRSMLVAAMQALEAGAAARRATVSAAKVKIGEAARQIGQQGIQLHGAIGMTHDFAVGHYYKRLETLRTLFGDPDYHLARFGRWQGARNDPS